VKLLFIILIQGGLESNFEGNEVNDTLPLFVICVKHAVHESGYPA